MFEACGTVLGIMRRNTARETRMLLFIDMVPTKQEERCPQNMWVGMLLRTTAMTCCIANLLFEHNWPIALGWLAMLQSTSMFAWAKVSAQSMCHECQRWSPANLGASSHVWLCESAFGALLCNDTMGLHT